MANSLQLDGSVLLPKRTGFFSRAWRQKFLLLMMIPGVLYFLIFRYIPMYGIIIAFKDFDFAYGISGSPWVGMQHFVSMWNNDYFWQTVSNTIKISILQLTTGFCFPILLALLLNELRAKRYKRVVQTISYMPHFLSWVVVSGLIFQLLSNQYGFYGYINNLFNRSNPTVIMQTEGGFMATILVSNIWKGIGYGSILYLARITGISPELYESAVIDGAGRFKQCIYITIPQIAPTIAVMLVLAMGGLLDGSFEQIYNLRNPIITPAFETIDTYVLDLTGLAGRTVGGARPQYSFSTAVNLSRSVIALGLVMSCNWIAGKVFNYTVF